MIYAFDHPHKPGDICSVAMCEGARRAPVLAGTEVFADIPMLIVRAATPEEYLTQPIPEGWYLPPLAFGCEFLYEILSD